MKTKFKKNRIVQILVLGILFFTFGSCKKDEDEMSAPSGMIPELITKSVSGISQISAISGGNITSEGSSSITYRGICWNTSPNPTISNSKTTNGSGVGNFTSTLTGLTANNLYYVRAYATNSYGTSYGNSITFTTAASSLPSISTSSINTITQFTAQGGGNVSSDGGSAITTRGICWSTNPTPTTLNSKTSNGTGTGSYSSSMAGLIANTLYYVRAYATKSAGTAYGNVQSFSTLPPSGGTVIDIDGNSYNKITIGTQVWMAENLKTTKYQNGETVPTVASAAAWFTVGASGASCIYDNDISNLSIYGRLYNWYAVADVRNLCPTGWHVPTDAEWTTLTNYLGGAQIAGGKLKEAGNAHWNSPNTNANNQTGFTALPGGFREAGAPCDYINEGYTGSWWSSTQQNSYNALNRDMHHNYEYVGGGNPVKGAAFSVRCIKN